jgi:hypothetical protein
VVKADDCARFKVQSGFESRSSVQVPIDVMFLQHWLEVVPDLMPRPGFKCIVEYQVQVTFGS